MQIKLQFNFTTDTATVLSTPLTMGGVREVLTTWVRGQMGQGADPSPPSDNDVVTLNFDWDPSDDTITCSHDCGNASLALALVQKHFINLHPTLHRINPKKSIVFNAAKLWDTGDRLYKSKDCRWSKLPEEIQIQKLEELSASGHAFLDQHVVTVYVEATAYEEDLDEEDREVEGSYNVTIEESAAIKHYADIALDVFSSAVAISCLEDFSVEVKYDTMNLSGDDEHSSYSFSRRGHLS
jgi:hypothetical protein